MKRFVNFLIIGAFALIALGSCGTSVGISAPYYSYDEVGDNVVVRDGVCYVYYDNPSIDFLNTLRFVNGSYYYWYSNRYVPVEFPRWNRFKHDAYRRDYRYRYYKPKPQRRNFTPFKGFYNNKNFRPNNRRKSSFGNMRRIPNTVNHRPIGGGRR